MYSKIVVGVVLILAPMVNSLAATPAEMLQQSQNQISQISTSLSAKQKELEIERAVLERHRMSLAEARQQLDDTETELAVAEKVAQATQSDGDVRELKRVQDRFERHRAKVERYIEREAESLSAIANLEQEISRLQSGIVAQRRQVTLLTEQLAADRKAASTTTPAPKPAATPVPTPAPTLKPTPTAEPQQTKTAGWPTIEQASDADVAYARSRLRELAALKTEGKLDRSPLPSVEIEARLSFGSEEMEYIGDDLYSLVEPVKAGRQNFKLFNKEYWFTIPEQDDKALFRILFDVSSISQPKLILFREDLLTK